MSWLTLAREAHKQGRLEEALEACGQAPSDTSAQAVACSLRASILTKLGRDEEALLAVEKALGAGARSVQLYRLAASIRLRQRDREAALGWLDRGLEVEHGADSLLELRERVVADLGWMSGLCEQFALAVRHRPHSLEDREKLIRAHLRLGFHDGIEEHLDAAIALAPRPNGLLLDKAGVLVEQGRQEQAKEVLEVCLSAAPSLVDRRRIVSLFLRLGELERAWTLGAANLEAAEVDVATRVQAASLALWRGEVDLAAARAAAVGAADPGGARLHAGIALVRGDLEAAFDLTTTALSAEAHDAGASALRGAALFLLGNYADAEACARAAMHGQHDWSPGVWLLEVAAHVFQQSKVTLFQVSEILQSLAPLWPALEISPTDKDLCLLDPKSVLEALRQGVRQLSANFSSTATFREPNTGTWRALAARRPARLACLRVFDWVQVQPFPWVREKMQALEAQYPTSPYVHTHAAELALWSGDYRVCEEECRKALEISKIDGTRWAWVGLGAALMLQDRFDEALAVFEESNQRLPVGSPLLAYRGETRRRMGEGELARVDLLEALRLSPSRVSCWVNLGLVALAMGEGDEANRILNELRSHLPRFLGDVEADLRKNGTLEPGLEAAAVFSHALAVMRGNRSANRITYFLGDERARVVSTVKLPIVR